MTTRIEKINQELNNGKPIQPTRLVMLLAELKRLGYYKPIS